jgi:hypothetical protein
MDSVPIFGRSQGPLAEGLAGADYKSRCALRQLWGPLYSNLWVKRPRCLARAEGEGLGVSTA